MAERVSYVDKSVAFARDDPSAMLLLFPSPMLSTSGNEFRLFGMPFVMRSIVREAYEGRGF